MATKWGVLSAGAISHDFVTAVRSMGGDEHQFVSVSAQVFAKQQKIPKAYGSYEELAEDPNVEVVYTGAINTANKYIPGLKGIRKGVIGDVYHVNASLGIHFPNWEHIASRELGGGTVLDLGVYPINLVEQVFNSEMPEKIKAIGRLHTNGIDLSFSAVMEYRSGKSASISSHCLLRLPNDAVIVGTKGIIKVCANFQGTQRVYVNDVLHKFPFPATVLPVNFGDSSGLRYEANEVRRCLKAGERESNRLTHTDSVVIAKIEDEIRRQIGVKFDVD